MAPRGSIQCTSINNYNYDSTSNTMILLTLLYLTQSNLNLLAITTITMPEAN